MKSGQVSWRMPLAVLVGCVLLSGCKGGNSSGNRGIDYSKLETTQLSADALVLASSEQLASQLKNGLRLSASGGSNRDAELLDSVPLSVPVQEEANTADRSADASSSMFSETNVHVAGVDEADYAKYDGQHWFVATQPHYRRAGERELPSIRIFNTDPSNAEVEYVTDFALEQDWGSVSELYLVTDTEQAKTNELAVLRHQSGYNIVSFGGPAVDMAIDIAVEPLVDLAFDTRLYPRPSAVRLQWVDVSDVSQPKQSVELEMDGSLIGSRKIDNRLYVITRYNPWLHTLKPAWNDTQLRADNEEIIKSATITELLPTYSFDGQARQPLVDNCLIQGDADDNSALSSLVTITTIDLASHQLIDSTCANINVHGLYMSKASLYLGGTRSEHDDEGHWQAQTILHKFALNDAGVSYRASGAVPGQLGWQDPSFRMDEKDGHLRIVTTTRDKEWQPDHALYVLNENATTKTLEQVAKLPNKTHPSPIGKPNEDIYAVRFVGDKAYIVTFERIDPLYVLDLSSHSAPVIAGELEVPGFSTYLHPVTDNYLFSVGRDVNDNARQGGVKLELYNISDMANPTVAGETHIIGGGGSYSEALNDLRAMSFLRVSDDQLRVSLPMTVYRSDLNRRNTWDHSGLYLFEINGLTGNAGSLDAAGKIISEQVSANFSYPQSTDGGRSVLHDEAVFFTSGGKAWSAFWSDPKGAKGPVSAPVVCTLELRPGLTVTVQESNYTGGDVCDATVQAANNDDNSVEQLIPVSSQQKPGTCVFEGAYESAGNYTVSVAMAGYYTQTIEDVVVTEGECHVFTQELEFNLQKQSSDGELPEPELADDTEA